MNRIQDKIDKMETENPGKLVIVITGVILAGWLTFVLAAWNQNLLVTILAMVIPAVLFRASMSRKMFGRDDLEMILFGILLWNHMVALIIILFVIKVLFSKLRK